MEESLCLTPKKRVSKARSKGKDGYALKDNSTCAPGTKSPSQRVPGSLPKALSGPASQPTGNPLSPTWTGAAPHPVTLLTKQMPGCQDGWPIPVPSDRASACLTWRQNSGFCLDSHAAAVGKWACWVKWEQIQSPVQAAGGDG